MVKKLIVVFFTVTIIFSSPVYPAEISVNLPPDIDVPLELALEWLRGEGLPEELKEIPITVPLIKPAEKNVSHTDAQSQINAISHVFRQYNKKLDNATASEYANIVKSTSEKFGEDPFVIAALIVVESGVRPDARSKGGDYGFMQVRWRVHKEKLMQKYPTIKSEKDMFRPRENIIAGTEILSNYRKSVGGDIIRAMVAYSGGSTSHWEKVNRVVFQIKMKYNELSKG